MLRALLKVFENEIVEVNLIFRKFEAVNFMKVKKYNI